MNGKRLHELWKRGTGRLSDIFGSHQTSDPGTARQRAREGHISLISATMRLEKPVDKVTGLVAKMVEEDRSTVLLRTANAVGADATRRPSVIDLVRAGTRTAAYSKISFALSEHHIDRVLGIPQSAEDLLNAIAASDITGASFALWITEGYDFHADRSADLLNEALQKAKLCFAASESLRGELQKRYGRKVWMIPLLNSDANAERDHPSQVPSPQLFEGLTDWIWKSLEAGTPMDDRFERLFSRVRDRLTPYVDPPAPADIHWEMEPHFQALYRLRASGLKPDFVVDVGASTGYWSHIAKKVFPSCRCFLIEPLLEKYLESEGAIYRLYPEFVKVEAAAGNVAGELEMNVSSDLYGSSFFDSSRSSSRPVRVRVRTLDEIAASEGIVGRGLLKIDVQFSEHLVLDGAIEFLKQVDVVFIEVSLRRFVPECKTFIEIVNQLHGLGFEYRDYAGTWRDPGTGELFQQDAIFARQNIKLAQG